MYNDNDFLSGVVAGRALHGRHIGSKGGVITSGTLNVTDNGTYNVTTYDKISVNVPHPWYSVAELLEGSTIGIPCFTQGITTSGTLTLNHIGSGYVEWNFVYSSDSMLPAQEGFINSVMCPPVRVMVPGFENYLKLPDLTARIGGAFTSPSSMVNNPGNCGLRIEKITPDFAGEENGRSFSFNTSTMYRVTLTGSDWDDNRYNTFRYEYKLRTYV